MAIAEQQSRRHFDLQSAAAAPPPSSAHLAQICSWQIQSQGAAIIGAAAAAASVGLGRPARGLWNERIFMSKMLALRSLSLPPTRCRARNIN